MTCEHKHKCVYHINLNRKWVMVEHCLDCDDNLIVPATLPRSIVRV